MAPHHPAPSSVLALPVHTPGLTRLAFSPDGQFIFTGGTDTIVRVFQTAKGAEAEPLVLEEHTDEITFLDCSRTSLVTSCADAVFRSFALPSSSELDGSVTYAGNLVRATGMPVRCGVVDSSGLRAACCADDGTIKILPTSLSTLRLPLSLPHSTATSTTGHSSPARSLAFSPDGGVLLTAGCDGNLLCWDTSKCAIESEGGEFDEDDEDGWEVPVVAKAFEGVFKKSQPEDLLATRPVWHSSGKYFVIPTKAHEILVIQRDGWKKIGTFSNGGHDSEIAELAFSSNGKYLASSGVDGKILVWEVSSKAVIATYQTAESSPITSLAFSPKSNLLAFTDAAGTFTRWSDPVPSSYLHPAESGPGAAAAAAPAKRRARSPLFGGDEFDVEDEEVAPRRARTETVSPVKKRRSRRGEDEEGEGDDTAMGSVDGEDDDDDAGDDYGDDWIIDDDGEHAKAKAEEIGKGQLGRATGNGARELVRVAVSQEAFQPGSTGWKSKKRYLSFNMVGSIDATDMDTHHVVNVEFHNTSKHRGFHFADHSKYSMAALGDKGAAFASQPDSVNPTSTVHYRPFDTFSSSSSAEWTVNLPPRENALALAVGGSDDAIGSVVIATDKGYLRFFTGSGVQTYLWNLGESVVSMVAGESEVAVVYRSGSTTMDGAQNLRFILINLLSFDLIQEGTVPLLANVTLKWLGFSDIGELHMVDSRGILSALDRYRRPGQARWVPVLDSNLLARKQGKDETYWPVGIVDEKFMALIIKGQNEGPGFPRPLVSELDIHLPLLNMDTAQGQLEEACVRQNLAVNSLRDRQIASNSTVFELEISQAELAVDKSLLQLIQTACKADKLARALDLATLLASTKSIESAAQIASFYHLPGLQEKITALREVKEDELDDREDADRRRKENGARWGNANAGRYVPQGTEFDYVTGNAHLPPRTELYARAVPDFAPRPVGGRKSFNKPTSTYSPAPPSAPSSRFTFNSETEAADSYPAYSPPPADENDDVNFEHRDDDDDEQRAANAKRARDAANESFGEPPDRRKRVSIGGDVPESAPASKAPPKNPFAKKDTNAAVANPFARSNVGRPVTVAKSTSFFDRVDENRDEPVKTGKKGKVVPGAKSGPKQTTLFGLPPVAAAAPSKKGRPPGKTSKATSKLSASEAVATTMAAMNGSDDEGGAEGAEVPVAIDEDEMEDVPEPAVADDDDDAPMADADEEETQKTVVDDEDGDERPAREASWSVSPEKAPAPAPMTSREKLAAFKMQARLEEAAGGEEEA